MQISGVGLTTSFVAGAISFVSPCVLPLVPGYVSYIASRSLDDKGARARLATHAAFFVLGFSTVFVALGASATLIGQALLAYRYQLNILGGAIVILFGAVLLRWLTPMALMRERRFRFDLPRGRALSSYLLGIAFAFGWTPCIGPILGAILTVGAVSTTVAGGAALLAIYSFGLAVPFLLSAIFTDTLAQRLKLIGRAGRALQLAAGAILVVMGLAMMSGRLNEFSYWLLDTFPALSKIG